jgi:hypothetical protein
MIPLSAKQISLDSPFNVNTRKSARFNSSYSYPGHGGGTIVLVFKSTIILEILFSVSNVLEEK